MTVALFGHLGAGREASSMVVYHTRADRYAIVGFVLGVLCLLALLSAYSFVIQSWPSGLEGLGVFLYIATYPASLVGMLLSGRGRFSSTRRGLAVAGIVLSLAAALITVAFFVLAMIVLSLSRPE
jgi:hypothetical protein